MEYAGVRELRNNLFLMAHPAICLRATLIVAACICSAIAARRAAALAQGTDIVVRVAGQPRYTAIGALVEELSIGSASGAGIDAFTLIRDVQGLPSGGVILVDSRRGSTPNVVEFDNTGRAVRNFGRRGQGPGEFEDPQLIARAGNGRVLVYDKSRSRINVYSALGQPLGEWRLPRFGTVLSLGIGASGIATLEIKLPQSGRVSNAGAQLPVAAVVRITDSGRVVDTVMQPPLPPLPSPFFVAFGRSGGVFGSIPYIPSAFAVWSPLGYFATGVTSSYAINLHVPRGGLNPKAALQGAADTPLWQSTDPVISVRRNVPRIALSAAETAQQHAQRQSLLERSRGMEITNAPGIPTHKTAFESIRFGADGSLWVLRYEVAGAAANADLHAFADVFEPDGAYVGQLRLPNAAKIMWSNNDVVWALVFDKDDVPKVKRFRVRWQPS